MNTLNELSKGLLGRYIRRALQNVATHSEVSGLKDAHGGDGASERKTVYKRQKGVDMATKKLTEGEVLEEAYYKGEDPHNHHIVVNTEVKKRVGHGKVFKTKEGAQKYLDYHKQFGKGFDKPHIKVMSVHDAEKHGVDKSSYHHLPVVNEEVEQIDEISKETVVKYLTKKTKRATEGGKQYPTPQSYRHSILSQSIARQKAGYKVGKNGPEVKVPATGKVSSETKKEYSDANKALRKKMNEEVEQIDEISKKTLKSYLTKNEKQTKALLASRDRTTGKFPTEKDQLDYEKRSHGGSIATKKLYKRRNTGGKRIKIFATEETQLHSTDHIGTQEVERKIQSESFHQDMAKLLSGRITIESFKKKHG